MGNNSSKNDLLEFLKDPSKNGEISDFLLNLLLVKYQARKAYLFETSNYKEKNTKDMLQIALDNGLSIKKDVISLPEFPRYWISKGDLYKIPETDEEIGVLLGMKDPGGEYYDYTHKRLSLDIYEHHTGSNITSELLQGDIRDINNIRYAIQKVESFNKVIDDLSCLKSKYHFIYELHQDDGSLKRLKELSKKNMKYIRDHKQDYLNDLYNAVSDDEYERIKTLFNESVNSNKLFNNYLPMFVEIYNSYNDEMGN
jgi:hypothetical protein